MQKMTDAQRALAEKHLPLVTWVLNNRLEYWRRDEYDDMWQSGAMGLCRAAMRYDESKGTEFCVYAFMFIRGAMINAGGKMKRQADMSGDARLEDIVLDGKDAVTLADQIRAKEDGEAMERMMLLRETMDRIKGRQRDVLDLYLSGFGQDEIGRMVGISQPGVSRSLTHSRKLIADEYAR